MEEFLKIKAEELDYLISERERLDNKPRKTNKDKEDLRVISNLIAELSEQLTQNQIKDTSEELSYYNEERDLLDAKSNRTRKDKEEIRNINSLLKNLSERLKEMSSRKEIEEYEAAVELSEARLADYFRQLATLNSLENTLAPSVYQKAMEEINQLLDQEQQILSYNERIISTYNSLKENTYKVNIIAEIERLQKENYSLEQQIPETIKNTSGESFSLQNQIAIDAHEAERLSNEITYLKQFEQERRTKYDYNEVARVQQEITTIEKYLNAVQARLETNTNIMNNYNSIQNNYKLIKTLSNELTKEDTKEDLNSKIYFAQKILPENLQDKVNQEVAIDKIIDSLNVAEKSVDNLTLDSKIIPMNTQVNDQTNNFKEAGIDYLDKKPAVLVRESQPTINRPGKSADNLTLDSKIIPMNTQVNDQANNFKEAEIDYLDEETDDLDLDEKFLLSRNGRKLPGALIRESQPSINRPEKSEDILKQESTIEDQEPNLNFTASSNAMDSIQGILNNSVKNNNSPTSIREEQQTQTKNAGIKSIDDILQSAISDNNGRDVQQRPVQNEQTPVELEVINLDEDVHPTPAPGDSSSTDEEPTITEETIATAQPSASENTPQDSNDNIPRFSEENGTAETLPPTSSNEPDVEPIQEITRVRKPRSNMLKKIIIRVGILATTLVLIATGAYTFKSFRNKANQKNIVQEVQPDSTATPEIEILSVSDQAYVPNQDVVTNPESYTPSDPEETLIDLSLGEENITSEVPVQDIEETFSTEELISLDEISVSEQPDEVPIFLPEENTYQYNSNQTDLENAFMNSNLISNMAWDEYSANDKNWQGIKEENIKYWTDKPLNFEKIDNMDAYLVEQQDDYGNWVGMGYTDSDTFNQYLENLNHNTKGARR